MHLVLESKKYLDESNETKILRAKISARVEDLVDLTRTKKSDGTKGNLTRSKKNDKNHWDLNQKTKS